MNNWKSKKNSQPLQYTIQLNRDKIHSLNMQNYYVEHGEIVKLKHRAIVKPTFNYVKDGTIKKVST